MRVRLLDPRAANDGMSSANGLRLEVEVTGGLEVSEAKLASRARGGELQAEAVAGRCHAGQCRAEGPDLRKKWMTPAARREAVAHLRTPWGERATGVWDHRCGPDEYPVSVAAQG